jgi:hypothetical protein
MPKTKVEHALAVIKAGISAVPYVGGPIASLISDYIPTATDRTVKAFAREVGERLECLEHRIDVQTVNKDEFSELFKSCYLSVVRTHQATKIRAAAALIANILLRDGDPDKLSYTELDHFVRCVDGLSTGAIEVLGHAHRIAGQRGRGQDFNFTALLKEIKQTRSDMNAPLVMGLLGELNSAHLLHTREAPYTSAPDYSNHQVEVTPLGHRFVERLLEQV